MKLIKSIPEYYEEINLPPPKYPFFHIGRHEDNIRTIKKKQVPIRHELYSISITNIHKGDLNVNYTSALQLFIISPFKVISWDITRSSIEGIYIIFNNEFIKSNLLWSNFLADFSFFRYNNLVTESLPDSALTEIYGYFPKIEEQYNSNERDKFEVIKAYVHIMLLLFKKNLKNIPANIPTDISNNNKLLADFELALINAVGNPDANPDFRKPSFYAAALNIHVNHLNAVIKAVTGKTTSDMIQQHIIQQASILLQQPNQTIKGIAAHFLFTDPTHFISYFKKHTRHTPKQYQAKLAN